MKLWKKILVGCGVIVLLLVISVVILIQKEKPADIVYGMSFNTFYAEELGLDWQETYDAIIHELNVKHVRLAAHWPMIEPINDVYNFSELDYQLAEAEKNGVEVILAVGRRLPRWPECHVPDWTASMSQAEQQQEILDYVSVVMNRYRDNPAITYWQIENEPYLEIFAKEHCGDFDQDFFEREVAYFRAQDDSRPFLVTDSGNLGTWFGAYKHGDAFGTSVYVHFWNPELGQFRTILPPWWYRLKEGVVSLIYGEKETMLIELSAEPWLLEPVTDVPIEIQYSRMNVEMFNDILRYAERTRYNKQYLWGAEWWYWLHKKGHDEMWERGLELFNEDD